MGNPCPAETISKDTLCVVGGGLSDDGIPNVCNIEDSAVHDSPCSSDKGSSQNDDAFLSSGFPPNFHSDTALMTLRIPKTVLAKRP